MAQRTETEPETIWTEGTIEELEKVTNLSALIDGLARDDWHIYKSNDCQHYSDSLCPTCIVTWRMAVEPEPTQAEIDYLDSFGGWPA